MTPEQLEQLLRITIERQDIMERRLDRLIDRLMFSPTADHMEVFQDAIQSQLDTIGEENTALVMGLNRIRADMPDSGRTIEQVSERADRPKTSNTWNPNI